MDGQTATLVDYPKARLTNTAPPFCGPSAAHGFDWLNERLDAFQTDDLPLGTMGFIRLGGLDPSPFTTRRTMERCRFARSPDDDGPPSADVKSSFRRQEYTANDDVEDQPVGGTQMPMAATSTAAGTNRTTPPSRNETCAASPEADRQTVSGAIKEDLASELNDAADAEPSPAAAEQCPFQRLRELSKRVANGDEAAIAEIQQILDGNEELWRNLGNVERTTEAMLIEVLAGSAAVKESVRRSVVELKQSLLGEQPTPLERMAVGRVVACWLFAHFIDRWCGWSVKNSGRASDLAKLLVASEKRHQVSLRSLKLVQGIKSPADRCLLNSATPRSSSAE